MRVGSDQTDSMPLRKQTYRFPQASVDYYFNAGLGDLSRVAPQASSILITDEQVFAAHQKKFKGWNTIVLKPGEEYKIQQTADAVIDQLIEMGADRKTTLVGIGGGVITDLTGYVASVYMRGIPFGFVPSSLLAMVDASIGGKNGIDVGVYKNMVGTIRQPSFLLFDFSLLRSLPLAEWQNGFAEVIKHACIKDAAMFSQLERGSLPRFRKAAGALAQLVRRNAMIKTRVVQQDQWEQGDRRLLNFGHTLGHALENTYELSHGQAISIGMTYAARISGRVLGFKDADRVARLLDRYGLPTFAQFDLPGAMAVMARDKKKVQSAMNYVLLQRVGKGVVHSLTMKELDGLLQSVL